MHQNTEITIPANLLLVCGTCIVNEAMLTGESTPLLKESIEHWEADVRVLTLAARTKTLCCWRHQGPAIELWGACMDT